MHPARLPSLLVALFSLLIPSSTRADVLPTRIMPLGDSITLGASVPGGYRNRLYQLLTTAGYNVDFVGTQTGNGVATLPDSDHQGHSGWRIDQLDSNILGWLGAIPSPDVVLVHIGTNDFGQNFSITNAIDRLDALITKIALAKPDARIIVTNLMERNGTANTNIQNLFNPFVQDRVNAQAALGRHVTFLDMRAAVPLADMADGLHPNQTGYNKMADAWLPAIQAVVTPQLDTTPPVISGAAGNLAGTRVTITFSKRVADGATNTVNYAVSGGLAVLSATLDGTQKIVTLTTAAQTPGANYTITVNGVTDRTDPTPIPLAANSQVSFQAAMPRGYANYIPESAGYSLVYSIDLPAAPNFSAGAAPYQIDRQTLIGPYSRVAYYLELVNASGFLQYAWVSMDAFTPNPALIGIPTLHSGAIFQQSVVNLNILSNVPGLATGTNIAGNIEFWPTNYQGTNGTGVPGATASFDFGDNPSPGNYGSMQVHNTGAAQTVFAFNRWGGTGGNADIGIGNRAGTGDTDWTFAQNATNFTARTLQVLVYTGDDTTPPAPVTAQASFGRTQVVVRFSEPLSPGSVRAVNFHLDGGVEVLAARLGADPREVTLSTTVQPLNTALTLAMNNLRDASPCANRIAAGSTIAVAPPALPAEIVANVGAAAQGYHLVATARIPERGNFNSAAAYSFDDRTAPGAYDRIAYYLELQRPGGPVQYVWTSMDAFTQIKSRVGFPTAASGAVFQQNVSNLDVLSNVPGVVTGTGMVDGNIEFWPTDYSVANGNGVPNASAATYDVGDTRSTAGSHGSMQVHNHAAGSVQTLLSLTNWGADGNLMGIGIGNNPAPTNNGVDWTHAANSHTYTRRVLHVLVRPSAPPQTGPAVVAANAPDSTNYVHVATLTIPASGHNASAIYSADTRSLAGPFDRVGYYLQLGRGATTNWVWTSMDAFTGNPLHTGLPTTASGANFQRLVANLDVRSNVPGVVNATGVPQGNIEFWPGNYTQANALGIPGASGSTFDFGDTMTAGTHGCMQVHNHASAQTVFAFNNWGGASPANNAFALGIGNQPAGNPDWTFAANGASYSNRVLHIYVRPGYGEVSAPTLTAALPSSTLDRVLLSFNEPMAETAADPANFSIAGLTVTGASPGPATREILLTTSPQTPGTTYTVQVTGARDRSPLGTPVAPGSAIAFTAFSPAPVLANVPESANYETIYRLAMPNAVTYNTVAVPYAVDESRFPQFQVYDRIAYCMELQTASTSQWVYVSMDAFTPLVSRMGVPTASSGAVFQQLVTSMNVLSSPGSGITNGLGLATGNIEFWPTNYSAPNAVNVPGTTSTTIYDWGDTRSTTGNYGSMQVHNHGAGQTLFAYNNWGGGSGNSCVGIGNDPAPVSNGLDWTFHQNAATYTVKNLHVLARRGGTLAGGTAPVILTQPQPQRVNAGATACFAVSLASTGSHRYQWRRNGSPLPGQTEAWLELPGVSPGQAGDYDVVVTAVGGAKVTSAAAPLVVDVVNHAPTFAGYSFTTTRDTPKATALAAILAKGFDADGDTLVISALPGSSIQGGTVATNTVDLTFTPAGGFTGNDGFAITLSDGNGGSVTGTVAAAVTALDTTPAGDAAIAVATNGVSTMLFIGQPGVGYEIERATGLNPADWVFIGTATTGDDGILLFTDPNPASPRSYYRSKRAGP